MFGLVSALLGKKTKVDILGLCSFEGRVKNVNQKDILWKGEIDSENNGLVLTLLGSATGPYKYQVDTVSFLINELDVVKNQIIEIINNDLELNDKFQNRYLSKFHLGSINPWKKNEISYELSFYLNKNDGYVGAIFKNGKITEVNL